MKSLSQLQLYAKSRNGVREQFVPDLSLYFYYFKRRPFFIIDFNGVSIIFKNNNGNLPFYISRKFAPFLSPMNHLLKKDWVKLNVNFANSGVNNLPSLKHIWDYCYANVAENILIENGIK